MQRIEVCIGSGCHLKGSYQIIARLKTLIAEHSPTTEIKLVAAFCQGRCSEGVVIKIDDDLITQVTPETIEQIFLGKVLNKA